MSPTAYYDLRQEANKLFQQRDYAKAGEAYERLTKAYPADGETWYWLGMSLYNSQQFRRAAEAFDKTDKLGTRAFIDDPATGFTAYAAKFPRYAALAFARANEPQRALEWLEKAIVEYHIEEPLALLQDEAFAILRENPRFQKLIGAPLPVSVSREEGWNKDIDYLLMRIRQYNPAIYSRNPLPEKITEAADALRRRISALTDAEIAVELQHLLALLAHGHSSLAFPYAAIPGENVKFARLPVQFYLFPEGIYIINARKEYEDLIGARIVSFDETPAGKALEAMAYLKERENDAHLAHGAMTFLELPGVLHALKLTRQPDRVQLTVIDRSGQKRTISPEPLPNGGDQGKIQESKIPGAPPPPLYLQNSNDYFWVKNFPEDKTLYIAFNQVLNKQDETLAQFGVRIRKFLDENKVQNLIVDVRRNNGGNTYLYNEFLRTLIAFDAQPGKRLFVITARRTYSAASNFITDVDRLTNAVFVGEPSSGKPQMLGGDITGFVLPYSKINFILGGVSWKLTSPRDTRFWIAPEIPIELNAKDYFANRDPALEMILALIKNGENGNRK